MNNNLPPVKTGYIRIFEDHTERYYTDFTKEEYDEMMNDPLYIFFREEIRKLPKKYLK